MNRWTHTLKQAVAVGRGFQPQRFAARAKAVTDSDGAQITVAFVQFACVLHCINEYVGQVTMCVGPSMLPTINASGDVVLLEKVSHRLGGLEKGDVVIANSPTDPNGNVCKRIRGLPGDTITVHPQRWFESEQQFTIPEGHMWLEGDNAANSTDSRIYGAVPLALLQGRVWIKIWPITQFGRLSRELPKAGAHAAKTQTEVIQKSTEVETSAVVPLQSRRTRVMIVKDGVIIDDGSSSSTDSDSKQ